jgi:hypothetical protein
MPAIGDAAPLLKVNETPCSYRWINKTQERIT